MTGLEIAGLVALVGGAGMQYKATSDAAKRQAEEVRRSLARQNEFQRQAEKKAMDQASEMNTDNRMQQQAVIEDQMAQEFAQPAQSAQQINAAAATTQGDVSGDYTTARARSEIELKKKSDFFARLMAKTGAANKLRGNEAIRIADTAAGIDRLANFARRTHEVDEIGINAAGVPNAGLMLGGRVLQGAGMMGMMSGAGAQGVTAEPGELGSGMYSTQVPTGIGVAPAAPAPTTLGTGFWGLENNAPFSPLPKSFNWATDSGWTSGVRSFNWPKVGG